MKQIPGRAFFWMPILILFILWLHNLYEKLNDEGKYITIIISTILYLILCLIQFVRWQDHTDDRVKSIHFLNIIFVIILTYGVIDHFFTKYFTITFKSKNNDEKNKW